MQRSVLVSISAPRPHRHGSARVGVAEAWADPFLSAFDVGNVIDTGGLLY
jgi:hypothetical protein